MRVGITIRLSTPSIWSNGIQQNAIYLAKLLQKAGHEVYLICSDETIFENGKETTISVLESLNLGLNQIGLKESYNEKWDAIIKVSLTVEQHAKDKWKSQNPNFKLVSYECSCKMIMETEKIIFNAHGAGEGRPINYAACDQVWFIPQHESMNVPYFQFINKCENATVVPFVWDSMGLESLAKETGYKPYNGKEIKKWAIMEPNTNVVKTSLIPILAAEKFHKTVEKIEHLFVVGSSHLIKNQAFINFIKGTSLFPERKISCDPRVQTHEMLHKHADAILSWQWENALNYFYIDVAYLGFPIIHNAYLCKDLGYYYEGCDVDNAIEKMSEIIKEHAQNGEYLKKMRSIVKRYTKENKKMVENYDNLLKDLIENKFSRKKYNWETNTIS